MHPVNEIIVFVYDEYTKEGETGDGPKNRDQNALDPIDRVPAAPAVQKCLRDRQAHAEGDVQAAAAGNQGPRRDHAISPIKSSVEATLRAGYLSASRASPSSHGLAFLAASRRAVRASPLVHH